MRIVRLLLPLPLFSFSSKLVVLCKVLTMLLSLECVSFFLRETAILKKKNLLIDDCNNAKLCYKCQTFSVDLFEGCSSLLWSSSFVFDISDLK